mmetsp:Transcript_31851/g.66949  ORF Transcript_31851/g.66949 Transcript_31851/m.66949 type:complete len:308 (+) Transcript_31851:390-1313(+)
MSYICNSETLVSGDLDSDGLLNKTEFLTILASGNDDCNTTTFDFSTVGCQCVYFREDDFDDEFRGPQVPSFCEADCSVVPLAKMYLISSFLGSICTDVMDFWISQGCINAPTATPTSSPVPSQSPSQSPVIATLRPTIRTTDPLTLQITPMAITITKTTNNSTTVAILAAFVALLGMGIAVQFFFYRRAQETNKAHIQTQIAHMEKEQKKRDQITRRKLFGKQEPFQPVLSSLHENENGELVLTPTNHPPLASILRCTVKRPDRQFPTTLFATSITIESLRGERTNTKDAPDPKAGMDVDVNDTADI